MTTERLLIQTWRQLPRDKQQAVIDFVQSIAASYQSVESPSTSIAQSSELGKKLQAIRDQIVVSRIPLLTQKEVEQEVIERRGGYQR